MKIRDIENVLRYRRIPYPKRSVELIAIIAISCTFFLFMHTKNLNTRLREMEVKLQPSELSALGLLGEHHLSGGDIRHSDDINTLHGTYQFLKSTGQINILNSGELNNTKHANQRILFFNRVAKVGSESMMELLKQLGKFNDFQVAKDKPVPKLNKRVLPLEAELSKAHLIASLDDGTAYIEHINYINFTKFNLQNPIYINLVRDPIERVISWYFYIRGAHKNAIYFKKNPNAQVRSPDWFKKDFNKCVQRGDPECLFEQFTVADFSGDYRRQSLFFCGHRFDCLPFNSPQAAQIAKYNVEKHYAIVGSWEDTNITLAVLENFIPRYFRGAKIIFELHRNKIRNQNKNTRKPKVDLGVKDMLRRNFSQEYDFYYFCKQRLYKQYLSINLSN